MKLAFAPLTPDRWPDLEKLFGERGACGGCWCMWWRLKQSEYEKQRGEANHRAFKALVKKGPPPGVLAYDAGEPVAWCAIGPRESFPRLERSRALKPVDEQPVWSVTCLFIRKTHRGKGVSKELLKHAAAFAAKEGARIVEGYPVEPRSGRIPDAFAWVGIPAAFRAAGFTEVLRRSPVRPIMRKEVA